MTGYADGTDGHSGTDTSRERAERARDSGEAARRKTKILQALEWRGWAGITVVDVRDDMRLGHHGQASSALTNLHKEGKIARLQRTRHRCHIYVLPQFVTDSDVVQPYVPRGVKTDQRITTLEDRIERGFMALMAGNTGEALKILSEES